MSDSLNNKELVAVGHHLAKALSSDTPIIDIAKTLSRLAERLDCTTAALYATQDQRDKLAAEKAALKDENEYIRKRFKELDRMFGKNLIVMQAAIIDWRATGEA